MMNGKMLEKERISLTVMGCGSCAGVNDETLFNPSNTRSILLERLRKLRHRKLVESAVTRTCRCKAYFQAQNVKFRANNGFCSLCVLQRSTLSAQLQRHVWIQSVTILCLMAISFYFS